MIKIKLCFTFYNGKSLGFVALVDVLDNRARVSQLNSIWIEEANIAATRYKVAFTFSMSEYLVMYRISSSRVLHESNRLWIKNEYIWTS